MHTFIKNKKTALFALANLVILLFVTAKGPLTEPDSASYMAHGLFRAPAYPLFLDLMKLVFGAAALKAAVFFQTAAILAAAAFAAGKIKRLFGLTDLCFCAVYAVLIWPLAPVQGSFAGNLIMTEAPAYAVYLAALAFLLDALETKALPPALWAMLLPAAAALIKPQFSFLYPSAAAAIAMLYYLDRNERKAVLLAAALLAGFACAQFADRVYHKAYNGRFTASGGLGAHVALNAVFLADDGTFTDAAGAAIYREARQRKLTAADFGGKGVVPYVSFYTGAFDPLLWDITMPELAKSCAAQMTETDCLIQSDKTAMAFGKKALTAKRAAYLKLVAAKLLAKVPLFIWIFMAAAFALSAAAFVRGKTAASAAIFLALLTNFLNYGVTVLLVAPINRLSFPTEIPLAAILCAAAYAVYRKQNV